MAASVKNLTTEPDPNAAVVAALNVIVVAVFAATVAFAGIFVPTTNIPKSISPVEENGTVTPAAF